MCRSKSFHIPSDFSSSFSSLSAPPPPLLLLLLLLKTFVRARGSPLLAVLLPFRYSDQI
jgi:hypothetical protein